MVLHVLDPTNEAVTPIGEPAPRPLDLRGLRIGFISNGKTGTRGFFTHLERMLRTEFGVAEIVPRMKSNFSAPADPAIVAEIPQWDAVVTGIGD